MVKFNKLGNKQKYKVAKHFIKNEISGYEIEENEIQSQKGEENHNE